MKEASVAILMTAAAAGALAQTTTTTIDSAEIITAQVNETFCSIFTAMTLLVAGIAALTLIVAGIRYMASQEPAERSRDRAMIVYAMAGMCLVLLACPLIDYIVEGTQITPFHESCTCIVGGYGNATATHGAECIDGTPLGECSENTAASPTEGTRCVINAAGGELMPVLVADSSCPVPTTSTTTSSTTSSTI